VQLTSDQDKTHVQPAFGGHELAHDAGWRLHARCLSDQSAAAVSADAFALRPLPSLKGLSALNMNACV
jgi:hypothetical protein